MAAVQLQEPAHGGFGRTRVHRFRAFAAHVDDGDLVAGGGRAPLHEAADAAILHGDVAGGADQVGLAQPPLPHLRVVAGEADVLPVQLHRLHASRQNLAHGERVLHLLDDEVREHGQDLQLDAIVELVHAVEQPRVGEAEAVELRADPLLAIRGALGVLGHADRVGGVVRAVRADQHAAALREPRDAEGAEEGVQQARVVRVLDVLEVELPVVRQPLREAPEHLHRLAHHATHAADDLGAEVLLDRRRLGRQRREDEATERGRPQLARAVIGLAEIGGHAAAAVAALLERNADQVAAQVIAPRVVDALERVLHAARVVQRDQGAAVRAAILERVDTAVLPAHYDHRHLADERRPELAGLGDIGLQAHEAPGGAFEDAAQLGAIVRLVLVDPERHAGKRDGRPGAGRLAHGREYTPVSHASGPAVDRSRGATSLAEYRGVPRLGRGAPSVWGV